MRPLYGFVLQILFSLVSGYWRLQKEGDSLSETMGMRRLRVKRQWNVPILIIPENDPDFLKNHKYEMTNDAVSNVQYSLRGSGVDEFPLGIFRIDSTTGRLHLTRSLDREQQSSFLIHVYAHDHYGREVDASADITIRVLDQNDETPKFVTETLIGEVTELSPAHTFAMQISATDADDPNSPNSKIQYKFQKESSVFYIINSTGKIMVKENVLDREKRKTYNLVVIAVDCNGEKYGLSSSSMVKITVTDANDSPPVFIVKWMEIKINENTVLENAVSLLVEDGDERGYKTWNAVYRIVMGNGTGHFAIHRDSSTNAGILSVIKEFDYEVCKEIKVVITVENEVPFVGSPRPLSSSTVIVKVFNVIEAPIIEPPVQEVDISGDNFVNKEVVTLKARDPEDPTGKNIRYKVLQDPAGVVAVDPESGILKTVAVLPPDTSIGSNHTYTVLVGAVNTAADPPLTSTGTILMTIVGENQHMPFLLHTSFCHDGHTWPNGSYSVAVLLVGVDPDPLPNGPPLSFKLIKNPPAVPDPWVIHRVNGTSAILRHVGEKPPCQRFKLLALVQDRKGLAGPIIPVYVRHCDCGGIVGGGPPLGSPTKNGTPFNGASGRMQTGGIGLSPGAIAAIVLSILGLLLLALMACFMLTFWGRSRSYILPDILMAAGTAPGYTQQYSTEAGPSENVSTAALLKSGLLERQGRGGDAAIHLSENWKVGGENSLNNSGLNNINININNTSGGSSNFQGVGSEAVMNDMIVEKSFTEVKTTNHQVNAAMTSTRNSNAAGSGMIGKAANCNITTNHVVTSSGGTAHLGAIQQPQGHQIGASYQQTKQTFQKPQGYQIGASYQKTKIPQYPVEIWSVFEQRARDTMHKLSTPSTRSSLAVEKSQDQHTAATSWDHMIEVVDPSNVYAADTRLVFNYEGPDSRISTLSCISNLE
uniref:cadherin-13-like isoform X2 n=1 Tax=Myxine glutinosa TaxID=7769 RepID=UPI00358F8937